MKEKLFVIRKYIMAKNIGEVIKKDKLTPIEDVWVHEDFRKNEITQTKEIKGYN